MSGRFVLPLQSVYDSDGSAISGAKAYFFESGTSTPQTTYSDSALSVANTNPVVANSSGQFPDIFLSDNAYKFTLARSDESIIYTADPVRAGVSIIKDVQSITTTTIIAVADENKLFAADATTGAFTVTLPAAATAGNGFEVAVKKTDPSTNIVTLDADGTELIDGETSQLLETQHDSIVVRCNGTAWFIINKPPAAVTYPNKIATTSGTSFALADDLSDLADVNRVEITFDSVSTDADAQPPLVQIGPAAGVVTTGYAGSAAGWGGATSAQGAVTNGIAAALPSSYVGTQILSGTIILTRHDPSSNLWFYKSSFAVSTGAAQFESCGSIALAGALADITLTTPGGTANFDGGEVGFNY